MKKYLFTILFLSFASIAHAQTLGNGLVGYWPLDWRDMLGTATVIDRSGKGNTGSLSGTPPIVAGKIGQALNFLGTTVAPYVNAGTASTLRPALPFSVSAWIRFTATSTANLGIFSSGRDSGGFVHEGFNINVGTPRQLSATFGNNTLCGANGRKTYVANTVMNTDTWYHVVAVFPSSASIYGYVNGVLDNGTLSGSASSIVYGSDGAWIGRVQDCSGGSGTQQYFQFPGTIDDVRLYNRVLSAAEVQELYRYGAESHQNSWLTNILQMFGL